MRISGATFKDAPGWAMLIRLCENVSVSGIIGNFDSPLKNVTLENVVADVVVGPSYEAKATEPLRFVGCLFNGKKVPDRDLVTERGERQPLVRESGVSWETAKPKK